MSRWSQNIKFLIPEDVFICLMVNLVYKATVLKHVIELLMDGFFSDSLEEMQPSI